MVLVETLEQVNTQTLRLKEQVAQIHLLPMLAPMLPICWAEVGHLLTKAIKPTQGRLPQGNLNYKTQRSKV
jgi:hypothetical protein